MNLLNETPNWYYEKKDLRKTPSVADGIPYETEVRYRRESARFILKVGLEMRLRYDTLATGVVYMHRFYMCHSFKQFSRFVTACGCLFLAGKVEETPKKCKDIIKVAKSCMEEHKFDTFGEDPKETVMIMERILLQTINFDLQVDHPYKHLLTYAKHLNGDRDETQKLVQTAWTFINDSLCTTICLQWEPEIVAIAVMYLSAKMDHKPISKLGQVIITTRWWEPFVQNISSDINELEDVCHQILDLFSDDNTGQAAVAEPQPLSGTVASVVPVIVTTPN